MITSIVSGYYQLLRSLWTGRITWQAYHRSEVCYDCDERKDAAGKPTKWCRACGCYIPAKVRDKVRKYDEQGIEVDPCPRKLWSKARLESVKGGGAAMRGACN